jgi:hypothetical protein
MISQDGSRLVVPGNKGDFDASEYLVAETTPSTGGIAWVATLIGVGVIAGAVGFVVLVLLVTRWTLGRRRRAQGSQQKSEDGVNPHTGMVVATLPRYPGT